MTKADIIERIQQRSRVSRKEVGEIVELVFEKIKKNLETGDKVKLSGFGNFIVHSKHARRGRNPQTGEEITISSRRVLSFRPSQVLKDAVRQADEPGGSVPSETHPLGGS